MILSVFLVSHANPTTSVRPDSRHLRSRP